MPYMRVVTAQGPPGPIITKGPITDNPVINTVIGAGVAGASQAGFAVMTQGPEVLATSCALNLIAQATKGIKLLDEHVGLLILMFIVAIGISYFILFDHNAAKAFMNASNSTVQALLNYKADKAAGINALAPTPEHKEYLSGSFNPIASAANYFGSRTA